MAKKPTGKSKGVEAAPAATGRRNVCIEKIANGYLLRESGQRGNGEYFERTTFTPRQPKINIVGPK